ncbi:MAG TPA: hypothetical protein VMB18_01130 [Terriglobales bacterium]|nr:hypothetical protein [Terriglobales bacterium]
MKRFRILTFALMFFFATAAFADTIILKDGTSYIGECKLETVNFSDVQGVQYQFPAKDVQSLAFNATKDTVVLRDGKSYSGHFTGLTPIAFQDAQGVKYQFPTSDLDAVVFSRTSVVHHASAAALVIPIGTDLPVRTNELIDSTQSYEGQTYSAAITEDVLDTSGNVAIPAGSSAQLIIRKISKGGAIHSPEVVLDLYSVSVGKKQYQVISSDVAETNRKGVGANRRTAETVGGGTALGALVGGIFGGGKGAGVGALAGAGGGLLTQVFTRGKEVKVPAESVMRFRLEKTLVLEPAQ